MVRSFFDAVKGEDGKMFALKR